jgi:hypothetical protein
MVTGIGRYATIHAAKCEIRLWLILETGAAFVDQLGPKTIEAALPCAMDWLGRTGGLSLEAHPSTV